MYKYMHRRRRGGDRGAAYPLLEQKFATFRQVSEKNNRKLGQLF